MNPKISIKPATNNDLHAIRSCADAAYQIYVPRIGQKPAPMVADFEEAITKQIICVAHLEHIASNIVGFVVFYERGDHMHLENIAVAPKAQGNGVGRALISFVEQSALAAGCNAVELYTNEKMTENLTLYPKLGYEEIERRQEDGFNRVYFRKEPLGRLQP